MAEFQLGKVYRDGITGVVGIAVGIYTDITQEQSVKLKPRSKDGIEEPKDVWINLKFLQEPDEEGQEQEGTTE